MNERLDIHMESFQLKSGPKTRIFPLKTRIFPLKSSKNLCFIVLLGVCFHITCIATVVRGRIYSIGAVNNCRNILCDGCNDCSLNCRKRQLRPQFQRLLGNSRNLTYATLLTVEIHPYKSRKMPFFLYCLLQFNSDLIS